MIQRRSTIVSTYQVNHVLIMNLHISGQATANDWLYLEFSEFWQGMGVW